MKLRLVSVSLGLLALGIVLSFWWLWVGVVIVVVGLLLLVLTLLAHPEASVEWKALSEFDLDHAKLIVDTARRFAGLVDVLNVIHPRVAASHTHVVDVLGVDKSGEQVLVGVDPRSTEVVKMFRLCPRTDEDAVDATLTSEQAERACREFLRERDLRLPERFALTEPTVVSIGPWQRWRLVWRHTEQDVTVLPDFVTMEVNAGATPNVILYSRVEHPIDVDLVAELTAEAAAERAVAQIPDIGRLALAASTLAVTYPNHFFDHQVWEWSDDQALCWILSYERDDHHALEVWVDATTGAVVGGELCHLHAPEVFGIDAVGDAHMESHVDNVWTPYLEMMKFDVSSFDCTNTAAGFAEATITDAIADGRYFVVEGHGDTTPTAEKVCIAYQGTEDEKSLTPDEVPANNLRFVLLDTCQSGEDGTGLDFKDTFISQGADVFIGFDAYMCAWAYEERLLHYLAQGRALANAHSLADAEVSPSYPIVITYDVSCLNKVRLAPIGVTVSRSPSGAITTGSSFTVSASLLNREDVDHTAAQNVEAELKLPAGFNITSGVNPQPIGTLDWNTPTTASWTVTGPGAVGSHELDVEVWSDNLGTAVDDPSDPFHTFDVDVVSRWGWLRVKIYALLELIPIPWPWPPPIQTRFPTRIDTQRGG